MANTNTSHDHIKIHICFSTCTFKFKNFIFLLIQKNRTNSSRVSTLVRTTEIFPRFCHLYYRRRDRNGYISSLTLHFRKNPCPTHCNYIETKSFKKDSINEGYSCYHSKSDQNKGCS